MTDQPTSPATTRQGVFQEISVLAGAVAAAGAAITGDPADASAALPVASTSAGVVTADGTYVRLVDDGRSGHKYNARFILEIIDKVVIIFSFLRV